ncbi:MAG: tryptophan synthase subunit alpha [Rhodospirillaceae bacterium]|nr:tryptophan synthase subunit alpha [Rhodospirillaceae bacterium]
MSASSRIERRFAALKAQDRGALVTFVTAGDPDHETSRALLEGLPGAGADIVELGMPFSDPMADGPSIQKASLRALASGASLKRTLELARAFRDKDPDTPLILMGYFNPIYIYGTEAFVRDAAAAGVDGMIVVDLPPEEDEELRPAAESAGMAFVRLATPTSDEARLPAILGAASGFIYYVSILGITGTRSAGEDTVRAAVAHLRAQTDLPLVVGFGIKTPKQAGAISRIADGAVIGSAIVDRIGGGLDSNGRPGATLVNDVLGFVSELANGVRGQG